MLPACRPLELHSTHIYPVLMLLIPHPPKRCCNTSGLPSPTNSRRYDGQGRHCIATFTSLSPTLSREVRDGFKGGDGEGNAPSAPEDPRLVLLLLFLPLVKGDSFSMSSFSCRCLRFPIALSSRSARATNRGNEQGDKHPELENHGEEANETARRDHTNRAYQMKNGG